ncbi:MAG: prevent-host-death protein [Chlorobium sp.]|nr:prevent-host-death protein [Chlorobium sp.]
MNLEKPLYCIAYATHNRTYTMKSASLPSLRVEPELRKAVEAVLQEGETLSTFIESSLRANIERWLNQKEFIDRGLASRDRARQSNSYIDAESVIGELRGMHEKAGKRSA